MFETVLISIIRQAAVLTKPQQDEFTTKAAEAVATLIRGTETGIDDALLRDVGLPLAGQIVTKLKPLL
ncbi:MAG: hypothetical protein AAF753_05775 [Pseudomonadota bacterium]